MSDAATKNALAQDQALKYFEGKIQEFHATIDDLKRSQSMLQTELNTLKPLVYKALAQNIGTGATSQ